MTEGVDAHEAWQTTAAAAAEVDGRMHEMVATLRWEAGWRVKVGIGWAIYFTMVSGWIYLRSRNALEVAGSLVCMAGAVFLAVQWYRFVAKTDFEGELSGPQYLEAIRMQLERQRQLALQGGIWSLLPLIAGLTMAATGHLEAENALHLGSIAALVALVGLVIGFAWFLSVQAAAQVQFRIDEVDAASRAVSGHLPPQPR